MQVKDRRTTRRAHSAQFKAEVLRQCHEPGASVAAVAMANGVNANLVRNWLVGRGLKRAGIQPPSGATKPTLPAMRFVPVGLAAHSGGAASEQTPEGAVCAAGLIDIALCHGDASLSVRWPGAQAQDCATWLREVAATLLQARLP